MQRIDYFKWLTEVLQCLGGTPLQVETTKHLQFKKMTISFEIPLRQDPSTMMAIVASGKESPAIVAIVAMRNMIDNSGI